MMTRRLDIMLVDDDAADLALFARAVSKTQLSINLQCVSAGQEAIDYLEAKGAYADRAVYPLPDVIVLDLKMPGLNGFDFLAWRQASSLFLTFPVVVLSGSTDQSEIKRVFQLGANQHLVKPTHFDDWLSIVSSIYDFAQQWRPLVSREEPTDKGG